MCVCVQEEMHVKHIYKHVTVLTNAGMYTNSQLGP